MRVTAGQRAQALGLFRALCLRDGVPEAPRATALQILKVFVRECYPRQDDWDLAHERLSKSFTKEACEAIAQECHDARTVARVDGNKGTTDDAVDEWCAYAIKISDETLNELAEIMENALREDSDVEEEEEGEEDAGNEDLGTAEEDDEGKKIKEAEKEIKKKLREARKTLKGRRPEVVAQLPNLRSPVDAAALLLLLNYEALQKTLRESRRILKADADGRQLTQELISKRLHVVGGSNIVHALLAVADAWIPTLAEGLDAPRFLSPATLQHISFIKTLATWALQDDAVMVAADMEHGELNRWRSFMEQICKALLEHITIKVQNVWSEQLKIKGGSRDTRQRAVEMTYHMAGQSAIAAACPLWKQFIHSFPNISTTDFIYKGTPGLPLRGHLEGIPFHFVLLSLVPQIITMMEGEAAKVQAADLITAMAAAAVTEPMGAGAGAGGVADGPVTYNAEQQRASVRVGGALAHYFLNLHGRKTDISKLFTDETLIE